MVPNRPAEEGSKKWSLNPEAFSRLLLCLDSDRGRAGQTYEQLRLKLIRFFSWEGCLRPDEPADESLNRLARKLSQGETIQNPNAYLFGMARFVLMETLRQQRRDEEFVRAPDISRQMIESPTSRPAPSQEACLRKCLHRLSDENRRLILRYYEGDKRARIRTRHSLAQELNLEMNALRNRALRLRSRLESCVRLCMEQWTAP